MITCEDNMMDCFYTKHCLKSITKEYIPLIKSSHPALSVLQNDKKCIKRKEIKAYFENKFTL